MSPKEWLRSRPRRKVAGVVRIAPMATAPTETQAAERIAVSAAAFGGATVAEASAALAAVTKAMGTKRPTVGCSCDLIVYSEHRCVTSRADFPADQR